jgi:hypothetical protein
MKLIFQEVPTRPLLVHQLYLYPVPLPLLSIVVHVVHQLYSRSRLYDLYLPLPLSTSDYDNLLP